MTTRKLAKQLGFLRQRSRSLGSKKTLASNQTFSYLIVIDFESTCWREKSNHSQEIIEFPAVLLNTSTGDIEAEFHAYVQPQEHPILSEFCTELTGITQVQVESGVPLQICLSKFNRWLQNLQLEKAVVFPNSPKKSPAPLPAQKLCTFLTWSDWDLGVCLQYECKRKQLHKPEVLNSWIDLRSTYRLFYSRKPKGLNGALQDLGIQFSGREHSGLDDSRNTARLAARMMRDGCIMRITRSLDPTPGLSKPNFGKSPVDKTEKANSNHTESVPTTREPPLFKTPHGAPPARPRSGDVAKRLERKENSGSAQPAAPTCQSLISPKTLLNSSAAPPWGCGRKSLPAEDGARGCHSVTINPTSPRDTRNQSLVLCSTTINSLLNTPLLHQASETGFASGLVDEECRELLVETEERPGSYDDVVLDREGTVVLANEHRDPEYICDYDSRCHEWEEPDESVFPGYKFKSGESLTKTLNVGNDSKMQKITSESSAKTVKAVVNVSNNLKERTLRSSTSDSATCSTLPQPAARSKAQQKTLLQLQETSIEPRKNCKTNILCQTHFVSKSTCRSGNSFALPQPVTSHRAHQDAPRSSFTIYTEPPKQSASHAPSGGPLQTPNNVLSSVTNARSSCHSRSFTCATAEEGQRVTSPLCACGRRAKRQVVSNGGPNHGRVFYCCPVRRSCGSRVEKGCQFFKWEWAVRRSSSVGVPADRASVSLCQFNATLPLHPPHRSSLRKSC